MSNAAFFSSFILNILGCMLCAVYLLARVRSGTVTKIGGRVLYLVSVIVLVIVSGILTPEVIIGAYERIGFQQDVGHGYYGFVIMLNIGLGLILLLVGQILIGWKKMEL